MMASCAAGTPLLLNFNERRMRFCTEKEVPNNISKLCFRYCAKTNWRGYCQEYKLDIYDLTDKDTFNKFVNARFITISEEKLKP